MIKDAIEIVFEKLVIRGDEVDAGRGWITLSTDAEDGVAPFSRERRRGLSRAADAAARRPRVGVRDAEDHSDVGVGVVEFNAFEMLVFGQVPFGRRKIVFSTPYFCYQGLLNVYGVWGVD